MLQTTEMTSIHKSLLRVGTNFIDTKQTTTRLCPINRAPKGQALYDTIAFLIFCPKHRNIAVCNTYHSNGEIAVWLPFIYLSDKLNYNIAIKDGLCLILSDYDYKLSIKYKDLVPYESKIFTVLDYYSPKKTQFFTRINCLAQLHSDTHGFKCCRNTSRIHWLSVTDICESNLDEFWGPQVLSFCIGLKTNPKYFQFEYCSARNT